jgi:hypothetical protein
MGSNPPAQNATPLIRGAKNGRFMNRPYRIMEGRVMVV